MAGRLEIRSEWVPSLENGSDKNRRMFQEGRVSERYMFCWWNIALLMIHMITLANLMNDENDLQPLKLSSIWGLRSRCDWREKRAKLENAESAKCRLDSTHVIFTTTSTDWTKNISFDGTFLCHSEMFHSRIWLWGLSGQFFDLTSTNRESFVKIFKRDNPSTNFYKGASQTWNLSLLAVV